MKWSIFNYNLETTNYVIVRNTFNGALIKFYKNIYEKIDNSIKNDFIDDSIKEYIDPLRKNGLIVDDNTDEKNNYLRQLKSDFNSDTLLSLIIAPTYKCNFSCPYCYENGIDNNESLTKEDKCLLLDYIKNYLNDNRNIKKVNIFLYGGEPTLSWDYIKLILPEIKNMLTNLNINFCTHITTNGYLFDERKVDFLADYNWKSAEITLDGTEFTHNKRRCLKNGGETFKQIVRNISYIINRRYLQKINIRINISSDNELDALNLIDFLKNQFGTEGVHISLGPITDTVKETDAHKYINGVILMNESWCDTYLKLYKKVKDSGFEVTNFYTLDSFCLAKQKHSIIVGADKSIYKCLSMIGRKQCALDTLDKQNFSLDTYLNYGDINKCFEKECPLVPSCLSGCVFEKYIRNLTNPFCRKKDYDAINKGICEILYEE